ncbi:LysM peptidoglycan-binding domain-containing protein [Nocardioides sp. Soil805]|uniref:LysM peptidoglycan-binding domain-containing protein n=1 Tax=Nocardioides sp. Soil805 TaxID=1736416 RepID=UPI0007038A5D|nr:LysM peptidoglycan-binding domain-containing protein [Nocardioides sp. Soil805]KRF30232.1 hypothetical protein ASG94_19670 [Nocardioides sp. Soil805]
MSRGHSPTRRCLVVWIAATVALLSTWWLASGTAASLTSQETWRRSFEDLLVSLCAAVLLGCATRLWLVTTATTLALARGRLPHDPHGITRRLVLAACGAAVVAGVSAPAMAGQGGDLERLAGLPLPDRATASHPTGPASTARPVAVRPATVEAPAGDEVVVRAGDSLWSLAASRLPGSATPGEVDRAWRAVYAANRTEIGADPSLIRPGQRLHLPGPDDEGDDR